MAEKSSPLSSAYAFDNEEANQRYQDAYAKLLSAVDERQQKPMFDPTLLAAAQGFLTPNKTGSFFESLGNVAGNVNKAQQDEQARAVELAKMRLELAGMGVQQANQQSAMKMYREGEQKPSGAPAQPTSESDLALRSIGIEDHGVQVAPAVPLIPKKQFIASQLLKGGNVPDAEIAYDKYVRDDIKLAQNGMLFQGSTGRLFDMPDPTPVSVPFLSLNGEPFQITKTQARRLDQYAREGNNDARIAYENQLRGIRAPKPAEAPPAQPPAQPSLQMTPQTGAVSPPAVKPIASPSTVERPPVPSAVAPSAPPAAPPPAAPSVATPGMKTPAQLAKEKAEEESRRAIAQARETELAKADIAEAAEVKKENRKDERETLVDIKKAGRNQVNIADQYAKLITQYPNAIGTAAKPGFLSAGIKLLESGASLGGESAKASALQEAVATLTGTPEELSARRVMMGLAAEYLFNLRALAKGQGTITDYETRVLSSIGPGIEDDAKTARFKAAIMKMHGEAEIARANEYNEWKKQPANKGLGWRGYLGSAAHDEFAAKYDQKLARAYDIYLGQRPQQAAPAQPAQPASNPAMDFARGFRRP